jgi:hypothetical protein
MTDLRAILESERKVERDFVAGGRPNPKGWSVALTMFHFLKWRERMHDRLSDLRAGRPYSPPPENVDEFNDRELASGADIPLADCADRADSLLLSLIDVYEALGDRPFTWFRWNTTTEAILASSYIHPHTHIVEYLKENNDLPGAVRLLETTVSVLRDESAPSGILGVEVYNLGCLRVAEGRYDEALSLIEESIPLRPFLKGLAADDADLAPLRGLARLETILSGSEPA